ncbi:MAG: PhzF family phenazine biosynthesis protein [Candidatus Bathyarchaeota archaeon]|nr:PhzF family phenazine biosynthesis protein [Candidatus Bathyarchaeota archaeon]
MRRLIFCIVDVFAEKKYGGNQLAVFRNAGKSTDSEMQSIAKEMNYSETTFIRSDEPSQNGGYDVRIFTPKIELPFAGHPTLGTAYVINHEIAKNPTTTLVLNLKAGQIPVTFGDRKGFGEILWMKQLPPTFGQTFEASTVSEVLNLDEKQIDDRFPIQDVSTGVPVIIVPLKTLDAVKQARINREEYFEFIKGVEAKTFLIFCAETYKKENDLNVRFFADYFGIAEDPATGSANGCLTAYLVKHRYFGEGNIDVRVEQGYEVGRPSLLFLRGEECDSRVSVQVGGKVIMVAKGEFYTN